MYIIKQAPSGGGELVWGALNGIEKGRYNPSRTVVKAFQERIGISFPNSYGLLFQRMASKLSSWRCSKRRTKQITKHDKQVVKTSGKGLSHFDAAGFFVMYAKFCGC